MPLPGQPEFKKRIHTIFGFSAILCAPKRSLHYSVSETKLKSKSVTHSALPVSIGESCGRVHAACVKRTEVLFVPSYKGHARTHTRHEI